MATRLGLHRAYSSVARAVKTDKAPAAIGPYSQAIVANGMVFCSGSLPVVPGTGHVISENVADQTRQSLNNLENVLDASGSSLSEVVKTTVFLKDMNHFNEMNKVYSEFFPDQKPARSAVQVARLPKDVLVEIEAISLIKS